MPTFCTSLCVCIMHWRKMNHILGMLNILAHLKRVYFLHHTLLNLQILVYFYTKKNLNFVFILIIEANKNTLYLWSGYLWTYYTILLQATNWWNYRTALKIIKQCSWAIHETYALKTRLYLKFLYNSLF